MPGSSVPPVDLIALRAWLPTWAMVLAMAMLGGLVSYIRRCREGRAGPFRLAELIGELSTSGFAGALVGLLGIHFELAFPLLFALAGIAGHMGGRMVYLLEGWAAAVIRRFAAKSGP